ncbi:flavin reductase family protein [Gottfriedia acidiceleris]|uniref:flavin reductase family protein n=1 Tax=Gottfriedia acidiceleris TaxID=371036 RepID=UPI00101C7CCF|nr:flavin reductase family protein [Gottfriedia acidiceleris]
MKSFSPADLSERDNYKFLIGGIIPRPIAFVTTESNENVLNGAPFSYFNIVTANPPMISVSVQRQNGKQKDTARNAIEKKEFVVHIVDESNVEAINKTAAALPPTESEVEVAGLTPVESVMVSVPGVKESKIRMECILEQAIPLGKDSEACDLLIGKVVYFHIEDEIYENGRIDANGLKAVSRLAGNDYAKVGEMFTIDRP